MDKPFPAYAGDEPYVFVSYSHLDEPLVFKEIRWLQDQGINVYYDQGIAPGSEWSVSLARAIKGCSQFIYFITPRSVDSENCRRELNFALAEHRNLLAVHIEETDVPDGIRLNLDNRQAILKFNQSSADYQQKLLGALDDANPVELPVSATQSSTPRLVIWSALAMVTALVVGWALFYFPESRQPAEAEITSIVVLPFENLSPQPENSYLADGLSEELILGLGKLPGLRVAGRTSSVYYQTHPTNLATIGETLNVSHVLEGSVRREGNDIRVVARLIRISDGLEMTSLVLDRSAGQLLDLQSEIAEELVGSLGLSLQGEDIRRATAPGTNDTAAFELFLQARDTAYRGDPISAQAFYTAAIEQDSLYFEAYTGLAFTFQVGGMITADYESSYNRQMQVFQQVNLLDPEGARSTLWRDQVAYHFINRNFVEAEKILRSEIAGGNRDWFSRGGYGTLLSWVGLFDAGADYGRLVLLDEPFYVGNRWPILASAGQYSRALDEVIRCLAVVPGHINCLLTRSRVLARMGNLTAALENIATVPIFKDTAITCLLQGDAGEPCKSPEYGSFNKTHPWAASLFDATLAVYAGDLDRAFNLLEAEAARPHGQVDYLRQYGSYWPDSVRQHPRYVAVLDSLNLGEENRLEICRGAQKLSFVTGIEISC